jgi:hypothetical protein
MNRTRREVLRMAGIGVGALAVAPIDSAANAEEREKNRAANITIDNIANGDEISRTFTVFGTFGSRKDRQLTTIGCVLRDSASQIMSGSVTVGDSSWAADFEDVPDPPADGTTGLILTVTLTMGGDTPQVVSSEATNLTLVDSGEGGPIKVTMPPERVRKGTPIEDKPQCEVDLVDVKRVESQYVETGHKKGGEPIGTKVDAKYEAAKKWNADHGAFSIAQKKKRASYCVKITYTKDSKEKHLHHSRPRLQGK